MVEFLVIYFAIGAEIALMFFLVSIFIVKIQDMELLVILCVLTALLWPYVLVILIINIIKDKIVNKK